VRLLDAPQDLFTTLLRFAATLKELKEKKAIDALCEAAPRLCRELF
jgi:hypothetical protein